MAVQLERGDEIVTCRRGSPMVATYQSIGFTLLDKEVADPKPAPASEPEVEEWPLKSTTPAEYIEQHGEDVDPSDTVAARLALARKLVAAEG